MAGYGALRFNNIQPYVLRSFLSFRAKVFFLKRSLTDINGLNHFRLRGEIPFHAMLNKCSLIAFSISSLSFLVNSAFFTTKSVHFFSYASRIGLVRGIFKMVETSVNDLEWRSHAV